MIATIHRLLDIPAKDWLAACAAAAVAAFLLNFVVGVIGALFVLLAFLALFFAAAAFIKKLFGKPDSQEEEAV